LVLYCLTCPSSLPAPKSLYINSGGRVSSREGEVDTVWVPLHASVACMSPTRYSAMELLNDAIDLDQLQFGSNIGCCQEVLTVTKSLCSATAVVV
jgi:hypothetical protein